MHAWEELGLDYKEYKERLYEAYKELRQVLVEESVKPYLRWLEKDPELRAVALLKWIFALLESCESAGIPPEVVATYLFSHVREEVL